MKDNIIFNQINTLVWLEEQLKIQRYCVNDIDKIIIFYVYNQSKNKTINYKKFMLI
jgi:hypothetical protein